MTLDLERVRIFVRPGVTDMRKWQKRLERDRFPWPGTGEAARELDREELGMLLAGIDFWNAHRALVVAKAC